VYTFIKSCIGEESMSSFGKRANINPGLLSHWNKGETRPSPELLARVADALPGVTHDQMLKLGGYTSASNGMPQPVQPVRVEDGVELDPTLNEDDREWLRGAVERIRLQRGK
jgi:transcriptional regulator with XRE-family HTH domain